MRAQCMIREALHYKRAAFVSGLQAAGYRLEARIEHPGPDDVLVIWNRYAFWHDEARRFERSGARVVVAENGYLGKTWRDGEWFAMAVGHHAGAGSWVVGGPERWDDLGVELQPWRTDGRETVVLGQRGIGESGIASPPNWAEQVAPRVMGRIRQHPGNSAGATPLDRDLRHAKAVVVWTSTAALWALLWGVPAWSAFAPWIGAAACRPLSEFGKEPKRDDAARLAVFQRLIWAQWRLTEIRSGAAFVHLLQIDTVPV